LDVIGDVHGCWPELCDLWEQLGYTWNARGLPQHKDGRIPVFVGDLADRGPDSPRVLRTVCDLVSEGLARFVPGNHDDKLFRMLAGRNVTRTHGLDVTEAQLAALPTPERNALTADILAILAPAKPYLVLDEGKLVVAHAGIREEMIGQQNGRVREFTLYGDVRGFEPGTNKPIRYDWAQDYTGSALVAYGHTPQEQVRFVGNTINLDGGCVFGGKLCALRYPEREIVCVSSRAVYAYHEGLSFSRPKS
jgi:protein phosphatase